jgi:predicted glycoside hydrolase/deacetylase ChbG (UPF0249 family)
MESTFPASSASAPSAALVVTADDFGIGLATSRGIIQAHLQGPVTATSVMVVTGDHVRASAPLVANAPNLDVGLHLVLTQCGDKPLVARQSSGLVDVHGDFWPNSQLWRRAFFGQLNRAAVADEIAAQTERFHTLFGRAPAYVDAHHHAHQLPTIRDALLEVMEHDLLPRITRITREPPGMIAGVGSRRVSRLAAQWLGRCAADAFSVRWLWTNDYSFGMLGSRQLRHPFPWNSYLPTLPLHQAGKTIEWIVHPGLPDDTLAGRDSYRAERAKELTALTDPAQRPQWEHLRPLLARKSELARRPAGE